MTDPIFLTMPVEIRREGGLGNGARTRYAPSTLVMVVHQDLLDALRRPKP